MVWHRDELFVTLCRTHYELAKVVSRFLLEQGGCLVYLLIIIKETNQDINELINF